MKVRSHEVTWLQVELFARFEDNPFLSYIVHENGTLWGHNDNWPLNPKIKSIPTWVHVDVLAKSETFECDSPKNRNADIEDENFKASRMHTCIFVGNNIDKTLFTEKLHGQSLIDGTSFKHSCFVMCLHYKQMCHLIQIGLKCFKVKWFNLVCTFPNVCKVVYLDILVVSNEVETVINLWNMGSNDLCWYI